MPITENPVRLDMFQEIVNIGFPAVVSSDGSAEPRISFFGMTIDILVWPGSTVFGSEQDKGILVTASNNLYLYSGPSYGNLTRTADPLLGDTYGGTVDPDGAPSNNQIFVSQGVPESGWSYMGNGPTGQEETFFADLTAGINAYSKRAAYPYDYRFDGRYNVNCSGFYNVTLLGTRYPQGFVLVSGTTYVMRMGSTPLP